jgi:hypothetical protein
MKKGFTQSRKEEKTRRGREIAAPARSAIRISKVLRLTAPRNFVFLSTLRLFFFAALRETLIETAHGSC